MTPELKMEWVYRVRVRMFDAKTGRTYLGRRILRRFVGMETRFGEIPCYVFQARDGKSELSVPHYDLMEVQPLFEDNDLGLEVSRCAP